MSADAGFHDEAVSALQEVNSEGAGSSQEPIQTSEPQSQEPIQQTQSQAPQEPQSINPAWNELINEIPEGFRDLVTPVLKKWDQGVNQRFQEKAQELRQYQEQIQQFEPYSEFIQGGMTPEHFRAAQVILHELQSDPQSFYQRLGEHFNLVQQAQDAEQAQYGDEYGEDEEVDPRIAHLAQQQEQIAQYIEQQHQERIQQEANQGIEAELAELHQKYNLSAIDQRETLQRAVLMAQTNPNVTLEEAYRQWDAVKRSMFEQTQGAGRGAPQVISSGGGGQVVTPQKKPAEMSDAEFKDDLVNALKNAL